MTCILCGDKSKKRNKDFTRAVVEINNPEQITLLRKVVIPTSMGTEEQVPAAIGKYKNVLLYYEANKHVYLYSSDGIPTLLEMDVPQELLDKVAELDEGLSGLEQEFDEFKNSPDVVDIVATYADLQAYDTSDLGDKDVIRVLTDETHDDESSYYRWGKTAETWTFIGATGPYYTKTEVDEALDLAKGAPRLLTTDDRNWNTGTQSATAPYNCIALWLLPPGMYQKDANTGLVRYSVANNMNEDEVFIVGKASTHGTPMLDLKATKSTDGQGQYFYTSLKSVFVDTSGNSTSNGVWTIKKPADNLTTTGMDIPLAAKQGKILNEKITAGLGKAKTLSAADYNVNSANWADTDPENFNAVALCRLDPGYYIVPSGVNGYVTSTLVASNTKTYLVGVQGAYGVLVAEFNISAYTGIGVEAGKFYGVFKNDGSSTYSYLLAASVDRLDQVSISHPLSANQGRVLNSKIGDLSTLVTTNKSSAVVAINEVASNINTFTTNEWDALWA